MTDKTNPQNNSNNNVLNASFGAPIAPKMIMVQDSQNLSPKMLNSASAKQQNAPVANTTSTSSSYLQSKIGNIVSLVFKGK